MRLLRLIFFIFILLIIFAIVPQSFWNWLKPYFNWETLVTTLKLGFRKLVDFIQATTGVDLSLIDDKIRDLTGIDLIIIWARIKEFLSNFFERLANFFR